MKYWKELNELEEAVYQIKVIQSGLNLISESEQFTCYQPSDITQSFQTFVLDLNERMNDAVQKLDEQFNKVWDTVRDDTGRLGSAEEDIVPPWEEDLEAVKSLEEEHEASIRFEKIISNLPTMNTQDNYYVAGAIDDSGITVGNLDEYFKMDFTFDPSISSGSSDISIQFQEDNYMNASNVDLSEINVVTPKMIEEWGRIFKNNNDNNLSKS